MALALSRFNSLTTFTLFSLILSFLGLPVTEIGVINPTIQAQVRNLLLKSVHKPNILVRPNWYY